MSFEPFNFTCPYCNAHQAVTQPHFEKKGSQLALKDSEFGNFGFRVLAVSCANTECKKVTLKLNLIPYYWQGGHLLSDEDNPLFQSRILPESSARPWPDFIPAPIREDYQEACRIRDLSPKASATLARRCLQGMIRDFCGISKGTLNKEIEELKKLSDAGSAPKGVSDESIDGLDHARSIGNIGAHMEKDIDNIVPVDPNEAQILIEVVETLLEEWYVARHNREQRFGKLKAVAEEKAAINNGDKSGQ